MDIDNHKTGHNTGFEADAPDAEIEVYVLGSIRVRSVRLPMVEFVAY